MAQWVDHSDRVIAQATQTQKLILDRQAGLRGYWIGGNPKFLQPSLRAKSQIGPAFDRLATLVADNRMQTWQLHVMRHSYTQWDLNARQMMSLYARRPDQAWRYFNLGLGKQMMDVLRAQFSEFLSEEDVLRASREREAQEATRRTLIGVAALAVVTGVLLGIVILRQMKRVGGQYEEALEASSQSAALMTATLQSIGDAVLVTDAAGLVTEMNPVAERLTGWAIGEARGLNSEKVFNITDEATRLPLESPVLRVLREGGVVGLESPSVLMIRGGGEIPIDDSAAPIYRDSQEIAGTVLVFRDITERRLAERQRAEMYEKEHRIAESLQRSLLSRPSSDLLGSLTVETLYQPALEEAQVGGDFYDIIALEEGLTALVVGDVSGKGLLAASRTAEAKYTLRAYLREYPHASVAMTRLNTFLCEAQILEGDAPEYFLCLTLVIIAPHNGAMEVACAGMEPPILLSQSGQSHEIIVSGLPLGITQKAEYDTMPMTLCVGERLLITTDGITEARQGQEMLGNKGLLQLASRTFPAESLEAHGQKILDGAKDFSGGQFRDDVCLLMAART